MKEKIFILFFILTYSTISAQVPNSLTLNDKIYGLSKFWNEVNYNYVYLYKIDKENWDKAYKQAIENIQHTKNDYEYYRELQKLCAVLNDGHTKVYFPDHIEGLLMNSMFGEYRLFLMNVQGKVFVTGTNKSKANEIPLGSEVIKVNGLSTSEFQEKYVEPYLSTSTVGSKKNDAGTKLLQGLEGDEYEIEIKTPKGSIKTFYLSHSKTEETDMFPEPLPNKPAFGFRWLEHKTAYVEINSFEDAAVVQEFESRLPEIRKAEKIIIDIRNNGGGSSRVAKNIAKYFIKGDTIYGPKNYSREIIPTERAIGSFLTASDTVKGKTEWGLSKEETTQLYEAYSGSRFHEFDYEPEVVGQVEKLNIPTVILTSNYTASAAEDFLIYLYDQDNITRIGDFTYGSTGQPIQIELPGNGSAWICTKKVTLPNGEEFVGIGIKPQILVQRNLNDVLYHDKYDSQLEEAVNYLAK